jgi:hypothetical protein
MPKKKAKKATVVAKKATIKDQEIAELKERLATAEKRIDELSDAEKRLKQIEEVIESDKIKKSANNYPGSAYDLSRPRRPRRPWGRPGVIRYGIPF